MRTVERQILKVQLPVVAAEYLVLVYNKDKTIIFEAPISKEIEDAFFGDLKMFAEFEIEIKGKDKKLKFINRVEDQNW